jgi:hypothetical protein
MAELMKAKMYKYIFSILFICICFASKAQTIDGVLYTNFNNYYKWRGGAFDSTFLLPQTSATNGKRAGALRYSAADSSVYSWTGSQWIKLGGSDTSSLSNRIDARVKYTDTAAMLSPYLRSNVAAATYQPIGNYDTATVVKAYVTNAEAVTITKGQVVYIFGAQGDRASVKLAKNTSDTFSSKTLGIVRADIAAGAAGWITTQGQVGGINLGAYSPGDILWLDSVAGGFTKVKPVAPKHGVFIGVVERANAGNGIIYVKPQNGVELDEIHNVLITSPTNNQVLSYTASTGIWENKTVSASIFAYTAKTTTYTAGADDYVIHCTSGTFSVNLPTAVGITGKVYIIKNSGSGLITIDPNGSQTIDGVTTYTMGQAESVQVISTGSNWITL